MAAFALYSQPELASQLGFLAAQPEPVAAITCLFLHANVVHLLGNMLFLAAVGVLVETATGPLRYGLVYFASGLVGVLAHMVLATGAAREVPLIGASGAVAGLIGYYGARYYGIRLPITDRLRISVATVVVIWVALQLLGAVYHFGDSGGTSFWAHLGGLSVGLLLSLTFRKGDAGMDAMRDSHLAAASELGPASKLAAAKEFLAGHPDDVSALRQWVEAAHTIEDPEEEKLALYALTKVFPEDVDALARLGELKALGHLKPLQRRKLADKFREAQPTLAEVLLLSVLDERKAAKEWPDVLFSLADLKWQSDQVAGRSYLDRLNELDAGSPLLNIARSRGWI